MKTIIFFISLLCIVFTNSCSKQKYPRVEYKVTSSSSSYVSYTMVTGSVSQETVSGIWSKSFEHKKGGLVLLRATHLGIGSTSISVYVNKKLLWTKSAYIPGETIEILETLP